MIFYHCKNCDKREIGCHSYCQSYQDCKKSHEEVKKKMAEDRLIYAEISESIIRFNKMKRVIK